MQVKLTVQERLKDLRVERGLTFEQLAEATGISKSALGIDYDSLSSEEFVTQINILKKSKHLKSPYSQRGKASPHHKHGKKKR